MKSPKNAPRLQEQLNNRLLSYSVMASAVLAQAASHAAVQKTTPNVTLSSPGDTYNVVFNGETKFSIIASTTTTTSLFSGSVYYTNGIGLRVEASDASYIYAGPYVRALNAGFTVNSTKNFTSYTGWPGNMAVYSTYYGTGGGLFRGKTGKYIGIRFQIDGSTHYGWVQVDVNLDATSAVVNTVAYEDTPGLGIIAGSETSLPVLATALTAESTFGGIVLQWATESETDHLGFVIERRLTGSEDDWQVISSYKTNSDLVSQGNSSTHKNYQFTDNDVQTDMDYEYKVYAVDVSGNISSEQIIRVQHTSSLPMEMALLQNYPNPFNPSTHIQFDLPEDSHAKLSIYNVSGQLVDVLLDGQMNAGTHMKSLNASAYSAGIYFYELIAGDKRMVRKMHLIK